ncbi:MAG: aminotransferase class IV [Crocinitomicaceae bacterium]|nr:aminotransferase class IV [Crocinitomicaceae bacterium]
MKLSFNSTIIEESEFSISPRNRAYLYADGLFESIRVKDGKALNVPAHVERIRGGMKSMRMQESTEVQTLDLIRQIESLLEANKVTKGGVVRVNVDRRMGGKFLPTDNLTDVILTFDPLENNEFQLNQVGLNVDIHPTIKKQINQFSAYKTKNAFYSVVARMDAQDNGLDDYLITNTKGGVIESSNSNLLIISNGVIYTPDLQDGCMDGTMIKQIIDIAEDTKMTVFKTSIMPSHLLAADEVLLTNAIHGVSWVGTYKSKQYKNDNAQMFINSLNEKWA